MQVLLSYPAHAGYPVFSVFVISDAGVYWTTRWSLSSGSPKARPDCG